MKRSMDSMTDPLEADGFAVSVIAEGRCKSGKNVKETRTEARICLVHYVIGN